MIPSVVSEQVRRGVEDFLRTTFPITNPFFADALERLLAAPEALFRGPYLSIKLPFVPADGGRAWFPGLLPDDFRPWRHQEQAWDRLKHETSLSTLIATGTGSGKTECFLYPILDYCRAVRGAKGIKAILIYPMNALATDQARRLARMIQGNSDLKGQVTAGLFIGDKPGVTTPAMTESEVITDKDILRRTPPDILLTNYKMLDYLLIRPRDFSLWGDNEPGTLRYLVVDELHTFDGAQAADLACLIRRIKERVKAAPGSLCCVGTSATLGVGEREARPEDLTAFARQVFGESFDETAIVGESLQGLDGFLRDYPVTYRESPGPGHLDALNPLSHASVEEYLGVLHRLWFGEDLVKDPDGAWRVALGERLRCHAFFRDLLAVLGNRAVPPAELLGELRGRIPGGEVDPRYPEYLVTGLLALLSEARIQQGNRLLPLVQVRYQLWLRELRRMLAPVEREPALCFADDLKSGERERSLPVIHCRECGLAGWAGTMRDTDSRVTSDLPTFYNAYFEYSPQVVFLFPGMDGADGPQMTLPIHVCGACLEVVRGVDPDECTRCGAAREWLVPVWLPDTNRTVRRNGRQYRIGLHDCPSCGGHNSLTILGSRAASLISVIIAQLFTSPFNEDKKLLAFSDSVQDASHRSGFFAARTYTFSLRAAIQKVVMDSPGPVPLEQLTRRFLDYWRSRLPEPEFIATFLPPDMNWLDEYQSLRRTGELPRDTELRARLERRLDWEIWSEYTFDARIGRTLEKTGASTVEVAPEEWASLMDAALERLREQVGLRDLDRLTLTRFLSGVILNLKNRGGVFQAELGQYLDSLGQPWHLGKQKGKAYHRPYFSPQSRAPEFLCSRCGERFKTLIREPGNNTPTWYEDWLVKCLRGLDPTVGNVAREIYEALIILMVEKGILFLRSPRGISIWGLKPEIFQSTTEVIQMRCRACAFSVSAGKETAGALDGGPCLRYRCEGTMEAQPPKEDYYRRLYQAGDVSRIFTEEHTGLLNRERREEIEEGFRDRRLPGDPNLLSCTPTLEMGINIGDLSSLALCSVPPKPSNYLQRAGRAGRVNGNSFLFTVANARPHDLFFYFEPREMLEGLVEPPGCFLNASAVLERQFTAFVFDRWVESGAKEEDLPEHLRTVLDAIDAGAVAQGFPANILAFLEEHRGELEDAFLEMFGDQLADYTLVRIRDFSRGSNPEVRGLEEAIWQGLREVAGERKVFRSRVEALRRKIKEMEQNPAQDETTRKAVNDMKMERSALVEIIKGINQRHVLNFLTDEGLLPNYAFPESGVQLRSVIYRYNPKAADDEGKYKTSIYRYDRPAAAAIMELAPANHFYAEGRKLEIDQISLQHSKIEIWRFCDSCDHMALEENLVERDRCPRCGSEMWADEGQRRKVLRIRQVISTMSEALSRSYDESDDREPQFYQKNMFVAKNDADITEAYAITREEVPFGFEFFRKITLREVNLGKKEFSGAHVRIAGQEFFDRPFEICGSCGKVKKGNKLDHAILCRYWGKERNESVIEGCYLYREFTSEAIRILLPVASLDVDRSVHSFVAALDLGLRKKFRGDPGHLLTTMMDEPVPGSDVRKRYLVLYDAVPGGTGYLKELMRDKGNLIEVFQWAHDVLANCSCRTDPEKDGCYRCLLAYRGRHDKENTSRQAALRLLGMILENQGSLEPTERLDLIRLNRLLESELEGRFVEALRLTLTGQGQGSLSPQVVNGKPGYLLKTRSGSYLMEPQVELGPRQGVTVPSRADFVIYPERPSGGELPLAVFTDGYEFHADPGGNMRVGLDTAQRLALMRSGRYRAWSLTWEDVQEYVEMKPLQYSPILFPAGPRFQALLNALDPVMVQRCAGLQRLSSMGLLLSLLGEGREWDWRLHARAYLASLLEQVRCDRDDVLRWREELFADDPRLDLPPGGTGNGDAGGTWLAGNVIYQTQAGVVMARGFVGFEAASITERSLDRLVSVFRLEDSNAATDAVEWRKIWRDFLRLANLLQWAGPVDFVSAIGLKEHSYGDLLDEKWLEPAMRNLSEQAAALMELVDPSLSSFIARCVQEGCPLPEPGFELTSPEGEIVATAELAWPERKCAVLLEPEMETKAAFETLGWRVFPSAEIFSDPQPLLTCLQPGEKP